MTHQEFLDATSVLESPTAADHRKFSVKLPMYICPDLVHLPFAFVGDKAVHNSVLCPDLLLCVIRKSICFFCSNPNVQHYSKVQTIPGWYVYVYIWMTMGFCYRFTYTYQIYTRVSFILSRLNEWSKMVIISNQHWMNTWSLKYSLCSLFVGVCQRQR